METRTSSDPDISQAGSTYQFTRAEGDAESHTTTLRGTCLDKPGEEKVEVVLYISNDGITWQQGTGPSGVYRDIVYDGGQFVAVGAGTAAYSEDGLTFEPIDLGVDIDVTAIAYDPVGDSYMVVGSPGAKGISRAISFDGAQTWEGLEDPMVGFYSDVAAVPPL